MDALCSITQVRRGRSKLSRPGWIFMCHVESGSHYQTLIPFQWVIMQPTMLRVLRIIRHSKVMILDILFDPFHGSIFWACFYETSDPRGQIGRGCWIFPSTVRKNATVAYAPPSPSSTETSVGIRTNLTSRIGGARVPAIKSSSFASGPGLGKLRCCQGSYCSRPHHLPK